MKTLKNKMKNKKGFTLMEMLIVVAIMVVLMAVSIPVFSAQLTKARTTTDDANLRAARSIAITGTMMEELPTGTYYYHAETGTLEDTAPAEGYGQVSGHSYITVVIEDNTITSIGW